MGFGALKQRADGQMAAYEKRANAMIKAGSVSQIETLVSSYGARGGQTNFWEQNRRAQKAKEAYREIRNWVQNCVTFIAGRIAERPWGAGHYELPSGAQKTHGGGVRRKWYDKNLIPGGISRRKFARSGKAYGGSDIETDETHQSLWLLDEPNPVQGKSEFLQFTVMNLLVTGEWYWLGGVVGKGKSERLQIWAVPSSWIEPDHTEGMYAGYRLITDSGEGIPIPKENVAHGYFPDPSDPKGILSPLQGCMQPVKIDGLILNSQLDFMQHGINPKIALVVGETPTADGTGKMRPRLTGAQRKQITRAIRQLWDQMGPGDPAILDGLIGDIKKLQMTPQEMDWKQSSEVVKARICQAFRVNPILLGEVTPANKAQAVVAEQSACANVLNPIIDNISCAATKFVSQFYDDGDTLAVWLEQCSAKDEDMEMRRWDTARRNGDVTQDEYRSYMGLPPSDEEPEPQRSPLMNNPQTLAQITALAAQVSAGALSHDNAVQILVVTLQITAEDAENMLPDDPPEPPPMPALPAPPQGNGPPAKPQDQQPVPKPADGEPAKSWNEEDHPRDADGRFGSGGDASASDAPAALEDWWSGGYEEINEAARGGGSHPSMKGLDAAIAAADPLKEEAVFYRGISVPAGSYISENMAKGYSFTDDGYIAVSDDQSIAHRFAIGGDGDNYSYVVAIRIPAGTRMANVPSGIGERLLRRGNGRYFKVDKVTKRKGEVNVWDVDVRYIDSEV